MRILQLNLWNINEPLRERMDVLARGVKDIAPDYITFQEVSPIEGKLQIEEFADELGYRWYFAEAGSFRGRREGNAILSKRKALHCETVDLCCSEIDLQRVAICCVFANSKQEKCALISTHFAYPINANSARYKQAVQLCEYIRRLDVDHVIIGADLNSIPTSSAVDHLLSECGLVDAWKLAPSDGPIYSFDGRNPYVRKNLWPNRRIDYVLFSSHLMVTSCQAVFTKSIYGIVSDHYAIVADVEW
ncbi:MAG: endonuclease/exonuclease/phosphatase family protein [Candidatus Thiodiazotropha taylori]|nr:endonuclease/exonuclease/phosphatase family protein [Candidatus Thiodiazotropha taylori]MCG8092210.1 endonuclease/exonuclease/phosphatase family protein [Candidatus Thiodiazotropha endolucinida]MCG7882767.1 endonuclease/exonuclease/phosphatase family protein [Candidatus Thiodiazotropha taylori]MCG7885280.1 endonuclease/exonuclease/phosphatase family protein [Candidatus Thiodiazotropha taylori]MCG7892707.1 endonuclease/exonuclease/phosphatase family protein [Candidatus Thiodiazotropha taylori